MERAKAGNGVRITSEAAHDRTAYRGILKSAALLGSARVVTMVVGLLRTKFLADLLGPLGVGLIGTFETIITAAIFVSGLPVLPAPARNSVGAGSPTFAAGDAAATGGRAAAMMLTRPKLAAAGCACHPKHQ